jgi:hypothetical protein
MSINVRYEFIVPNDLYVCHCSAREAGGEWTFDYKKPELELGAYYRGTLTTIDAARQDIIGTQFTGFWDFTLPENAKYATKDEWQVCRMEDTLEWLCFHIMPGSPYKTINLVDPSTEPTADEVLYTFDDKAILFGK